MSEDRTQAASPRRRQEARERGVVAHSPELTAAVGLLAAVVLLGMWGESLTSGLQRLVIAPFEADGIPVEVDSVVATFRGGIFRVAFPLAGMLGGVAMAMLAAHQLQVGGLWAPALAAPDFGRLAIKSGPDLMDRAGRGIWGVAKAILVTAASVWLIRSRWDEFARLGEMDLPTIARTSGGLIRGILYGLGLALLALGLADFGLQYQRVEAMLRVSPDEEREDQKAIEGDPALRARRDRAARSRRADPGEVLTGASLILAGQGGLVVVLGGGPPPARVTVRSTARGASAALMRRSAEKAGLVVVEAPALALRFAQGAARGTVLPPDLALALARAFESRERG